MTDADYGYTAAAKSITRSQVYVIEAGNCDIIVLSCTRDKICMYIF